MRLQVVLSARGYVLFDDTMLDKYHRRRIGLLRRQYSGNAHGVIADIGLVAYMYVNPETNHFWLLDYQLFVLHKSTPRRVNSIRHCKPNRLITESAA